MTFGIFGLEDSSENLNIPQVDISSLRTHLVFASLALTLSEMYKVSCDVMLKAPQRTILGSGGADINSKFTNSQIKKPRVNTAITPPPAS